MRSSKRWAVAVAAALITALATPAHAAAPVPPPSPSPRPTPTLADTEPPSQPTGLWECAADYTGAVPFCWRPSTDNVGVVAYDVSMLQGDVFSRIGTVTVTSANADRPYFAATNLVPGRLYSFRVIARDAAGNQSVPSALYTARAQQGLPPPSPSPSPTPTPTPTPSTPVPVPACRVAYSAVDWGTGLSANVRVTNLGTIPIKNWTLRLAFSGNQTVTVVWNATATQAPPWVTFAAPAWQQAIDAGQTYSFGFNASYSGVNDRPTGFLLNGVPCTVTFPA
ncbi:cellulose binding domain-containing protein [Sphaerisporangium rhizosphaerae]|uniref:Cellulose binding domain-containing protein n=1 Tax=Sphaerisporangium rhizosphaerae TaxID=2269375 RepID=A0ABW2PHI0_9ACTN